MRTIVFLLTIILTLQPAAHAAEPFFKANDIIALVGGEDMVVAAELGTLETLIQLALPQHHLKFRSLAREGDTVFEQRRDLNYPSLDVQLDKMGATVVICQFGQMESLAGKEKLPEFIAAYEKLIARVSGGGKRRVALVEPVFITDANNALLTATRNLAKRLSLKVATSFANYDVPDENGVEPFKMGFAKLEPKEIWKADRIHLTGAGHFQFAQGVLFRLSHDRASMPCVPSEGYLEAFNLGLKTVAAKNRLWFYYYRPQNWAFLAGDRTNQPSSRDHLDPSKRWFPEELEKFVPLIEAKDAEIWALAAKPK